MPMGEGPREPDNPLGMVEMDGSFALPEALCSERRAALLRRNNRILVSYGVMAFYSSKGHDLLERMMLSEKITSATPFRISGDATTLTANYGTLQSAYHEGRWQLANQAFVMLYGSFEAYLADMVEDALAAQGEQDATREALSLLMGVRWQGKIDRVCQRLGISMGRGMRRREFSTFSMDFLGKCCTEPFDFLQCVADIRHRLVHGVGKVDAALVREYPRGKLQEGQDIRLPYAIPFAIFYFLHALSGLIDRGFCTKFGWPRELHPPERLL